MLVLLAHPIGLVLLTVASARARLTSWGPLAVVVTYTVVHAMVTSLEVASHFILAAGIAWVGVSVWKSAGDNT